MKIACVQTNVVFGHPAENAGKAILTIKELAAKSVDLIVFPEAFLTGYCVASREEALSISLDVDARTPDVEHGHAPIEAIRGECEMHDMMCVFGFAEKDGENIYNSAALIEPGRPIRYYRKTHIPHMGLDRFAGAGDELKVFDTRIGKIGILICFDQRYPEATRTLVLQGAELIVLPTNWPRGAEVSAEHISIARAAENRVFLAACNRCGEENGSKFIGRSGIYGIDGEVLAKAGSGEEILIADIELARARDKHRVVIPGEYETDILGVRRPELYREIVSERTATQ